MPFFQTQGRQINKNYQYLVLAAILAPYTSATLANVNVGINTSSAISVALGDQLLASANNNPDDKNDVRLSDMGPDGDAFYDARDPDVAYNSKNNEYLVVWSGDDDSGTLVDGEQEIFAQRIDAETGMEIGEDFRLSDMGPDGFTSYYGYSPVVSYNPANNEYYVVWAGTDNTGSLIAGEVEIYGQRINADGFVAFRPFEYNVETQLYFK